MDKLLETYNPPNLSQEAESLNRPVTASEIEAVIKKIPAHKSRGRTASQANFTKHLGKS